MSPLLLGAAWILFVISCLSSMTPGTNSTRSRSSANTSAHASTRPTSVKNDKPI
jgi:uncharacterized protein YfaQ (DUF2300 family)